MKYQIIVVRTKCLLQVRPWSIAMQNVIKIRFKCPIVLHQHKEEKELLRTRLFFFLLSYFECQSGTFHREWIHTPGWWQTWLGGKMPLCHPKGQLSSPSLSSLKCRSAPIDSFPTHPRAAAAHHCCFPRTFGKEIPFGKISFLLERRFLLFSSLTTEMSCLWHNMHLQEAALHQKLCLAIVPSNVPCPLNSVLWTLKYL